MQNAITSVELPTDESEDYRVWVKVSDLSFLSVKLANKHPRDLNSD